MIFSTVLYESSTKIRIQKMFCCTKYARRGSRYTKSYFEQTNTIKDNIGFTKRVFSHGLGCLTFILSYEVSWGTVRQGPSGWAPVRHGKVQDIDHLHCTGRFFSRLKVSHYLHYFSAAFRRQDQTNTQPPNTEIR